MKIGRRYCQICKKRPVQAGGDESCQLLKIGARRTFEQMWRAGLGDKPGHDCGAFKQGNPTVREPKQQEQAEGLF